MSTPHLEAVALAGDLQGVLLEARTLAAAVPGVHGRRRAGPGEAFWQYRDHRAEDGARLVDWRRSARGDRLFVREREHEAAQTAYFWVDPDRGMDWRGGEDRPTKQRRALTISLALAILLSRGGERVGALGQQPRAGSRASERLALDLQRNAREPQTPPARSRVLLASDFYAPIDVWRDRLKRFSAAGVTGAIVMMADPAEEDFPFSGRTLFSDSNKREALLGRAEAAQDIYALRLAEHRNALRMMAANLGFPSVLHRTDHGGAPALTTLVALLSERAA